MNYKDILIRAGKTFLEAFIPVLIAFMKVADFADWTATKTALYTTLVSAAAAGITAVLNYILQVIKDKKGDPEP